MFRMNPAVRQYLIHSYLYYELNESVISDHEYDQLCVELLKSDVDHPLVDKGNLEAGTGYNIKDYPKDIIEEAKKLLKSAPKPAAGTDPYEKKPLIFTGEPGETYILLGMYIDFGYAKERDRQDEIRTELQKRWDSKDAGHRASFQKYFDSWDEGLERFKLNGKST